MPKPSVSVGICFVKLSSGEACNAHVQCKSEKCTVNSLTEKGTCLGSPLFTIIIVVVVVAVLGIAGFVFKKKHNN